MEAVRSVKMDSRVCCAIGDEVWAATQSGGIAVFSARTGAHLCDVESSKGTLDDAQVVRLVAVWEEVWAGTNTGEIFFCNASRHTHLDTLRIPGAEKKVPIVDLCFNGHVAVIAAGNGSVHLHHPLSHKRLTTLSISTAPCTAATFFRSFIAAGDAKGGLHIWNPITAAYVLTHTEGTSEVVALLDEPCTGTLWVSRVNGHVDVYEVQAAGLVLQRRVSGHGRVTGMVAVSGTVLATTFTRKVVQIDATTAQIMNAPTSPAHEAFLHGCCKALRQEVAHVWTVGNDGTAHVWQVKGRGIPATPLPTISPQSTTALNTYVMATSQLVESELRVAVQAERERRSSVAEDLRRSRVESQELRLRLSTKEAGLHAEEELLTSATEQRKSLETQVASLNREVTEANGRASMAERERDLLRAEVTQLKTDLSSARAETSNKLSEKSSAEQRLSQEAVNKSTLEQRLRDAEGRLSLLQAEHRRVCDSLGGVISASSSPTKAPEEALLRRTTALANELTQVKRLNDVLRSAVASMEYTIRRLEEEDRDLTALLNAYRRRVAGCVSDPHLSALLLATIVRNAPRFDLDCNEEMKARLMGHHSPYLQFIQSLRATDPVAYHKLMAYLQGSPNGSPISPEVQAMLDRVITLASRDGGITDVELATFMQTIPDYVEPQPASGANSTFNLTGASPLSGLRSGESITAGGEGVSPVDSTGAAAATALSTTGAGGGVESGARRASTDALSLLLLRDARGQHVVDDAYIREQQTMFEFILKSRRLLVENLALLHKRTTGARQALEALCVNQGGAGSPLVGGSGARRSIQAFPTLVQGIIQELDELSGEVVQRYLTVAEKERLGVV